MGRKKIKRRTGQHVLRSKDFILAEEIEYIQQRAAERDSRFVTIGSLALFSTETGDAWLLDPAEHLAARAARDGDPEDVDFAENEAHFAIRWLGRIESLALLSPMPTMTPDAS
jgi:hypothetical protein